MNKQDIKVFYTQFAHYYELLSRDRDFKAQVDFFCNSSAGEKEDLRILELFAGPSYHGTELLNRGYNTTMVDYSKDMKNLAQEKTKVNLESQYMIGQIPSVIPDEKVYDLILCLRYSIGYLNISELDLLFKKFEKVTLPGSKIYFELHNIPSMISNLSDLDIRERIINDSENSEKIKCIWPYSDIRWSDNDWIASMDVYLKVEALNKKSEEYIFSSKERIYSINEILFFAGKYGNYESKVLDGPEISKTFPGCKLLELRRVK